MPRFRQEAIQAADNDVDYRGYDYLYIVAAGKVWPHGLCDFKIPTEDGMNVTKGVVVNEKNDNSTYIHELGHVLPSNYEPWGGCGLPDLYSYDAMERGEDPHIWVGPWDLMDNGFAFSAWSKITLGWLEPTIFHLDPSTVAVINLQPVEKDSGLRAVVVPLNATTSYVIEVRRRIGLDWRFFVEGVLIYYVDLSKENGHGVLRVYDHDPTTKFMDDAPLLRGDVFEDVEKNVYLAVAYTDGTSFAIVISGSKIRDTDQDGLPDPIEIQLGTDPWNPDTDSDGLRDQEELDQYRTDPLKSDSDKDGLLDGKEIQLGTDPLRADTDGDYWWDGVDPSPTDPMMPNVPIGALALFIVAMAIVSRKRKRQNQGSE